MRVRLNRLAAFESPAQKLAPARLESQRHVGLFQQLNYCSETAKNI
jgi:hypothetical protein